VLEPSAASGELIVHLDTLTPSFKSFIAIIDDAPAKSVESGFRWKLHAGANRLVIRSRNLADREGPDSSITIGMP
jgi:hypothetical protein